MRERRMIETAMIKMKTTRRKIQEDDFPPYRPDLKHISDRLKQEIWEDEVFYPESDIEQLQKELKKEILYTPIQKLDDRDLRKILECIDKAFNNFKEK